MLLGFCGKTIGQTTSGAAYVWTTTTSWLPTGVPLSSGSVTVNNPLTLDQNLSISSGNYTFNQDVTDQPGGTNYSFSATGATGSLIVASGTTTIEGGITNISGFSNTNFTLTVKSGATLILGTFGSTANNFNIGDKVTINIELGGSIIVYGNIVNSNSSGSFNVNGLLQVYGNYATNNGNIDINGTTGQFYTTGAMQTQGASGTIYGSGNDCASNCSGTSLGCGTGGSSYPATILPQSLTVCSGVSGSTSFTFYTTAPSPTYQWEYSLSAGGTYTTISGATSNSYTPSSLTVTTWYRVKYTSSSSDCSGTKYSAPVPVYVSASTYTQSTAGQTICGGVFGPISVSANGTSLTYQWYSNTSATNSGGVSISGATSNVYTPSSAIGGTQYYYCVINSSCGTPFTTVVSGAFINNSAAISSQSTLTQTKCISVAFSPITVTATGTGLTYQWYSNTTASTSGGTSLLATNGAQTNSYSPQSTVAGTLYYYCIVTGTCGTATSAVSGAFITNPNLTASVNIAASSSGAICAGTSVTFSATPTNGGTTPTYQWYKGGVSIAGQTAATYATTTLADTDVITVIMTSNATPCLTGSPATSNTVIMAVSTTNTWTGSTNASWFTASNWSCGVVPLITSDVIIPDVLNKPVIDGVNTTALANTITVNQWSSLTVLIGNTLKITDKLTNNNGTITFLDDASLVQINNVTTNNNIGVIDYNRSTYARKTDYTYWSSPVFQQTLGELISPDGTFYSYEASALGEDWSPFDAVTYMVEGKGYIANQGAEVPLPAPAPPPSINPLDVTFTGVPNNGHYEINGIFADKSYLLGNPYPSALDADTFLTDNVGVLDGTLYFWTHNTSIQDATLIGNNPDGTPKAGTGAYAYTSDDYATYNITGGTAAAPSSLTGGLNDNIPSGKIASGQGFFASSKTIGDGFVSNTPIVYNNTMRVGVIDISKEDNSQFFKKRNSKTEKVIEKNRIWLNLTNTQGAFKQTLVGYITDATNEYDDRFDGESFDGNEFVDFYSVNQDKNLVIQGRALPFDENDEVPLGYRTTINGAFTINIDQADGLLTNQAVYIEDKLTNTVFDLKSGNYTFNTIAGTFNDRFVLRYKNTNTNKTLGTTNFDSLENKILVSSKNKQIKINSFAETIDKVTIYDLLGRQICQKDKVNSNELSIANLMSSRQTLIVKMVLQNGQEVSKKIVY